MKMFNIKIYNMKNGQQIFKWNAVQTRSQHSFVGDI